MRFLLAVILSIGLLASSVYAEEQTALKDQKDRLSYSMGVDFGNKLKQQSIDINADMFSKGLNDSLSGNRTLLAEEEIKSEMNTLMKDMMNKRVERIRKAAEENRKEGEAFLAENGKKEGVITLPSGLQYKIIKEGTGKTPSIDDTVVTNYRGTLIDGTEFDSSYKRGKPATFAVKGVIPGWTEALQLMKEGAKWQLFIPSSLAYGKRGAGSKIGPDKTLIFEIELISIK
ncbi:MAG: FKBP-type peptidyl-prolyl cis-trans isomerase [Nitrospirota bacterium]|nr:FKBP-type peptidyl-prolyl cis-trans isomerase [Nitrospirota bacterium]